jgi:A/G-specific adenine glycosylase
LKDRKIPALVTSLLSWYTAHARDLPWRRTRDPYAVWVSEIMLQQTQVKTVIPFWERWQRELPTLQAAADASPDQLHKLWEGLGYYTRVRNLQKAAQRIVTEHHGQFPSRFEDVLALPGIGRYTAGAICSIAFDQPTPILDGNVVRVLTRIFGIAENPREPATNRRLWALAEELVQSAAALPRAPRQRRFAKAPAAAGHCSALNQSLMELGALICTPRAPRCPDCPARKLCVAARENRVGDLPNLGPRAKPTARRFFAFVIERDGKFLVRRRPPGLVNAHLWEFPNVEVETAGPADAEKSFKSEFGVAPQKLALIATVKHAITRYRITLEAFEARLAEPNLPLPRRTSSAATALGGAVWKTAEQLHQLAFTSAHRKVLQAVTAPEDRRIAGSRAGVSGQ